MDDVTKKCSFCDGLGEFPGTGGPIICGRCMGTGTEIFGQFDIDKKFDKVYDLLVAIAKKLEVEIP